MTDVIGNFYQDVVRFIIRVLIPFAFVLSIFLISQGTPQTLHGNLVVETMSGVKQTIAYGPMASLESIKHLGTNGGGFLGANSSTPFENPTYWSNFAEALSMMLIPGSLVFIGRMLNAKQHIHPHAVMVFIAMFTMFVVLLLICLHYETAGSPILHHLESMEAIWRAKKHVSVLLNQLYLQLLRQLLRLVLLTTCMTVSHLWVAWLQ